MKWAAWRSATLININVVTIASKLKGHCRYCYSGYLVPRLLGSRNWLKKACKLASSYIMDI